MKSMIFCSLFLSSFALLSWKAIDSPHGTVQGTENEVVLWWIFNLICSHVEYNWLVLFVASRSRKSLMLFGVWYFCDVTLSIIKYLIFGLKIFLCKGVKLLFVIPSVGCPKGDASELSQDCALNLQLQLDHIIPCFHMNSYLAPLKHEIDCLGNCIDRGYLGI